MKLIKFFLFFTFSVFLGLPLFLTVLISFVKNQPLSEMFLNFPQLSWTLENYIRVLNSQSLEILFVTFRMALINTGFTLFVGYTVARVVSSFPKKQQGFFLLIFLSPFLVNSIVRLLSFQNFVGVQGPLQGFIRFFDPEFANLSWSHHIVSMHVGFMLQYLPLALFPLYLGFQKWDPSLKEVALDLGATAQQIFYKIEWPWMKSWVMTAAVLVFIPSFGEYVVPEIHMGSKEFVWGQYISEAFLKWRNAPLGAALGTVMIVILMILHFQPAFDRGRK